MKFITYMFLLICSFGLISNSVLAEEEPVTTTSGGTPLTQEEIDSSIGRFGEVEEIPEDFQFNPAEIKLWHANHLANIGKPISLYYEFVKSGTFEEGFTDSVYLKILELNEDGTKNAMMEFFTADKKQAVTPDNVTNITGNPAIGIYMQGDVYEMNRITDGHWRHFQKSIKISLRNDAVIEPTTFKFNGKEYKGEKVYFSPYLNDPHRRDFEKFADKYYEFIFSNDIPGSLYQITTIIHDKSKQNAEPLILETLTLVDVKPNES
ncbi:MAG: hypothetical protein DHS20C09_19060 [marine bacterium B5-7]|nr:MAG: hypothetical protein DHS20C09_19060 [marine bacterium B5-7]